MSDAVDADLAGWRDPDQLLKRLIALQRQDIPRLKTSLERLIDHEDPDIREEAIRRLYVHGRQGNARERLAAIVTNDPDDGVRRTAAFAIGATCTPASRSDDIATLRDVLMNPKEDLEVRGAAYENLLILADRKDFPPVKRAIDLDRDVDWPWVLSL